MVSNLESDQVRVHQALDLTELSEVKGIFVICQDITIEQKRLEESLEQIKATEA
jgi:hypothetical protein